MAKLKFGMIVTDMRGKLGGHVLSKNRGGAYSRTKVTPSNPQSAAQAAARNALSQFSRGWRGLSQAQRDEWSGAVSNWTKTDVFGDIKVPSGNTLYTRLNINIKTAGGSAILSPPVPAGIIANSLTAVTYTASPQSLAVDFSPTPIAADTALVIEATAPLSPGISNANAFYRQITVLPAATASGEDIIAEYIAKFGTPIVGLKIFFRAFTVSKTTGERSTYSKFDLIA